MRLRGRKGIKESLERQVDLVVLNPTEHKGNWTQFFAQPDQPIHVELGMGKGGFISAMSVRHPEVNYIGMDMYDELVRRASEKARSAWTEQAGIDPPNLSLVRCNIETLEEIFAPGEINRIYLNFSDPWPKLRHARRRLTHPDFLRKYISLLNNEGEIHLKTDSQTLFEFSLNSFAELGLQMRNISLHLHREGVHPDHVMTEYEKKFSAQGMNIYRCEVHLGKPSLLR